MKTRLISFALVFIVSFPALLHSQTDNWKLQKDKNGIKVYTRRSLKSSLKDSKATAIFNASAKEAFDLFIDFDQHREWMDRIRASKLLKKASEHEFYVYYEVQSPWPASDRDLAILYKVIKMQNGGYRMDAIAEPDYVPLKQGMVRIPEVISSWEFIPKGNNKVEVIFTNHSDPGGYLPDWMVNMAATDNPYNTFTNMRKRLERN